MRASQERKDECARELRRGFDRGLFDERDLVLRLEMLERAVTLGELRRLTADLPEESRWFRRPALLRR